MENEGEHSKMSVRSTKVRTTYKVEETLGCSSLWLHLSFHCMKFRRPFSDSSLSSGLFHSEIQTAMGWKSNTLLISMEEFSE